MYLVVGTAGHIDHGKTALIRALTGIDTDRLPEEKKRGITVDLGFADLTLGDARISFVDVPGHERFVKNMLAGASGIDLLLLVVAADEGVMPQTREHFNICRLLWIENGIVVITKSDLADAELIELVKDDVAELVKGSFLEASPMVEVSSRTGKGLDELRSLLAASETKNKDEGVIARLPIDRSFAAKGFGTVVTGTLVSGGFDEDTALELLPQQRKVRARGIQSHGEELHRATAGRRTAVNLSGLSHHEVSRGMLLAEADVLRPASIFDVHVEVLEDAPPLRSRQRVRVHLGTAELLARVKVLGEASVIDAGGSGFAQIRLESPAAAILGEKFILRSYSPQATIAGGSIIRSTTEKPRLREIDAYTAFLRNLLEVFQTGQNIIPILTERTGAKGLTMSGIREITGLQSNAAADLGKAAVATGDVVGTDGVFVSRAALDKLRSAVFDAVKQHHSADPLSKGLPLDVLRTRAFNQVPAEVQRYVLAELTAAGRMVIEKETIRSASHKTELSEGESKAMEAMTKVFRQAGLELPKRSDLIEVGASVGKLPVNIATKLFQLLVTRKTAVQIDGEYYCDVIAIKRLVSEVRAFAESTADRTIDVPRFKDIAGISRKYAIPLLEYLDREHVTARAGDKRVIL
jgi:selenocysteine-specific elongation factor